MANELFTKAAPPPQAGGAPQQNPNPLPPPQPGGTPQQITTPGSPGGPYTPGAKKAAEQRPTGHGPAGSPPDYDPTEVTPEEQANYEQLALKAQESIMANVGGVLDHMNNKDAPAYESKK